MQETANLQTLEASPEALELASKCYTLFQIYALEEVTQLGRKELDELLLDKFDVEHGKFGERMSEVTIEEIALFIETKKLTDKNVAEIKKILDEHKSEITTCIASRMHFFPDSSVIELDGTLF